MEKGRIISFILKLTPVAILIIGLIVKDFLPNIFKLFVYWWLLVLMVFIGFILHFKSIAYFSVAFILFFVSAMLTTIGLREIAEVMMRISFIGLIIGLIQSVVEYKIS